MQRASCAALFLLAPAAAVQLSVSSHEPLPEGAPDLPTKPGCYVWMPNGCHGKYPMHAKLHWKKDEWGQANARAADGEEACEARKQAFDAFCGVKDAVMVLVPGSAAQEADGEVAAAIASMPEAPTLPTQRGCYVWLPNGCQGVHPLHAKLHWKKDEWGEANAEAASNAEACAARKEAFDQFCRVKDAVTVLVHGGAAPEAAPKGPLPQEASAHPTPPPGPRVYE